MMSSFYEDDQVFMFTFPSLPLLGVYAQVICFILLGGVQVCLCVSDEQKFLWVSHCRCIF